MKLLIKRSEWYRGEGGLYSSLLRAKDRKKCCLGFFGRQLGISNALLYDESYPRKYMHYWPEWMFEKLTDDQFVISSDTDELMRLNDSPYFPDSEREEKIKEIFAKHDVEVIFED